MLCLVGLEYEYGCFCGWVDLKAVIDTVTGWILILAEKIHVDVCSIPECADRLRITIARHHRLGESGCFPYLDFSSTLLSVLTHAHSHLAAHRRPPS